MPPSRLDLPQGQAAASSLFPILRNAECSAIALLAGFERRIRTMRPSRPVRSAETLPQTEQKQRPASFPRTCRASPPESPGDRRRARVVSAGGHIQFPSSPLDGPSTVGDYVPEDLDYHCPKLVPQGNLITIQRAGSLCLHTAVSGPAEQHRSSSAGSCEGQFTQ
jgi:hypothetical protein